MRLRLQLLALLLAAALAPGARGAVHPYAGGHFTPLGDAFVFRGGREGLFRSRSEAVDEAGVVAKGIANGKSYIRLSKVDFVRPKDAAARHADAAPEAVTGDILAVVFKVSDRHHIGYATPGGVRRYCCTAGVADELGCTPGSPVVTPHAEQPDWPWTARVQFRGPAEVALAADAAVTIHATGMYHLWFLTCDASLAATVVAGHTAWKNPGGYLPGMMAPNLPFFAAMSAAYVALGMAWMMACALAWRHVITLQHCISAVLLLGMGEMLTWYVDYATFNDSGFRPYGTTVAAVLLGAARKTLARGMLLVAAMGFGVVRPTLGDAAVRVGALAAAYFCATCGLDVTTHVGAIDDLSSRIRVFLVAPVAALDAVFILWTFAALSTTLGALAARRAAPKLELYRRFANALAGGVAVSLAWIGYEMWFKITDAHNAHWRTDWVTAAFWHALNLGLVAAMCVTWRPGDAVAQFVRTGPGDAKDAAPEGSGGEEVAGRAGAGAGHAAGGHAAALQAAERGAAGSDGKLS